MKIKVSEATGQVLNWLVAKADGWSEEGLQDIAAGDQHPPHDFSTDWSQGGPIIEREGIGLRYYGFDRAPYWVATSEHKYYPKKFGHLGPTALIAATRCFVASKLGDEIDVPKELL